METFNILAGLAGIIGTFIGIFSFLIGRRIIRISYKLKNTDLLGSSSNVLPGEVTIAFAGKNISDLKKLNCILWNSGNIEIKRDSLPSKNPITLVFSNKINILKASISNKSIDENQPNIIVDSKMNNKFYVDFEFLNPNQGINIEILYSGIMTKPVLNGVIIGAKKPADLVISDWKFNRFNNRVSLIVSILFFVIPIATFFLIGNEYRTSIVSASPFYVIPAICIFTLLGMPLTAIISDFISKCITKYKVSPRDIED